NQDDHVKNIAFLMHKTGQWQLSPAFDVTYSYNPDGQWTSQHQMSLNGKRRDFTREDFDACAHAASFKRGRATQILQEVIAAVRNWLEFAEEAGVQPLTAGKIEASHRLDFLA
ncbi:MAG: HipA domain-containing protein, partial [Planctomycetes bacterium]|nr:HipA domain-containing protein [Planctomycetota bacterium]